jgi:exopolysaccharide biosynthesis polyprenyl glycosylphosphotransferase
MQGKKHEIHTQALQIVDSLLILLSFWLARVIRDFLAKIDVIDRAVLGATLADLVWILFVVVPFGPIVLEKYGFYNHPLHKRRYDSLRQMFQALMVLTVVVAVGVIFFRLPPSSRLTLAGAVPIAACLLLARETWTQTAIKRRVAAGERQETVILAGSAADVATLREQLPRATLAEWRVAEIFDLESRPVEELAALIHQFSVARVIFAVNSASFERVQEAVRACEVEGVEAWVHAGFLQTSIARPTFDVLGNQPMLVFRSTPEISWSLLLKEIFDRSAAFILLLLLALPMLAVALAIRLSSPGAPVLFRQQRAGRHGRPFTMVKFRTMIPDAEKQLEVIKATAGNEMSGPVFKLDKDPRVLPIGRFLRKFSIDELPQLWNVLMGDMSIVGPRPLPLYEVAEFSDVAHRRRLSVKPGLTCLWQVSGRNEITHFDDWVRLDLEYIDSWSLWLDLKILLHTVPVVLLGKGAK